MTDLVAKYAAVPVPRYTSYPTAADFRPLGAGEHAAWLGAIAPGSRVSIYLHVPYCRALCHYCGCHAKIARRDDVIATYRAALEAEIAHVAAALPAGLKVARIAWGGGTPSALGAEGLAAVTGVLRSHFTFEPDLEHGIELDPRLVDATLAQALAVLGVDRASLGVQDLDPTVQEAIGRVQPVEIVAAATAALRQAGINTLNYDLIVGLPHQTEATVRRTAEQVLALGPDSIACYGYAHLPERRKNQRLIDAAALPSAAVRFAQTGAIAEIFTAAGYVAVGMDHFARPDHPLARSAAAGVLKRNFQGYTDDAEPVLIGFGASAISHLPSGYAQNIADPSAYVRTVAEGALPSARGIALDDEDRRRAAIIETLMCDFRVDLGAAAAAYAEEIASLAPLAADGLVTVENGRIELTEAGRPFVRLVAAAFDAYRAGTAGRFSVAV
ncbi:oxygen-independent coproporphyrinogen III oxidase [Prosthecomicrobium pneumaticum]|uniref:Coproporphyrinogen-III oxidase n=1 Tax=Prosthecomicrobium pneumaticum TaxID=81895 RepID=A0A7W9FJ59_9HYPH|nr:oxygen-independent coproporphyrinogen III oxidase [Prosthecomicrobium pneumaticum]MBB5751392.1 oxygen-independent coproporphyrinogen-3 oxidase [Prosthecomicrobium pneumaticum]